MGKKSSAPTFTLSLTLNIERLHHIMIDQLEVLVSDPVFHIPFPSCEEVVHHSHLMAIHHQLVSQVGTHKTSPTSDLVGKKHMYDNIIKGYLILQRVNFIEEPQNTDFHPVPNKAG